MSAQLSSPGEMFDRLDVQSLTAEIRGRMSGDYWFVVTNHHAPHNAFANREQLMSWMAERGLSLTEELPAVGQYANIRLDGAYRRKLHGDAGEFGALIGIRTREMDNSHWTAATVTREMDGLHTVNLMNVNCRDRVTLSEHVWPAPGEKLYFCLPDSLSVVDVAERRDDGIYVGRFSGKTFAELRGERPELLLCASSECRAMTNDAARSPVIEIDSDEYQRALETLPPEGWIRRGGIESFKCMERFAGDVTAIYAIVDDRYFQMRDLATLSHETIIRKVRESGAMNSPVAGGDDLADDDSPRMAP